MKQGHFLLDLNRFGALSRRLSLPYFAGIRLQWRVSSVLKRKHSRRETT